MNLPKELIVSWFPKSRASDKSDEEYHMLVAMELQFNEYNGKMITTRGGKELRDPVSLAPIAPQKVIEGYFVERNWMEPVANNGAITSLSQFERKWQEENPGKNTISPEFQKDLNAHTSSIVDFDFYN